MNPWIQAIRPRTLPLSIAGIITGGGIAYAEIRDHFNLPVFLLCLLTALLLQVLSNLANDYGDFKTGADNTNRKGPMRTLQSGIISPAAMRIAIFLTVLLTLISGIVLLMTAFPGFNTFFFFYLLLGIASIAAAIKYTMGKNPYGYKGWGDIFVFLFFGLVSSFGTYYLLTARVNPLVLLPSMSIGAWSMAVLNLNNLRDIESDKASGKITIPVRIGLQKGLYYQYILILSPFALNMLYAVLMNKLILIVLTSLLMVISFRIFNPLFRDPGHLTLDIMLKRTALFALFFTLMFITGNLL